MALPARGQLLLSAVATAVLACTTYSDEPPTGSEASAGAQAVGGTSDGGPSGGGSASGNAQAAGSAAAAMGGSGGGGSATGQAGAIDEGLAGAAACVDGDCCPDDPKKTQAGDCGCGAADVDSDTDGILDCQDDCPDDTNKANPGTCGCGLPEQDTAELAGCASLKSALIHRYDFEGGDAMVWDRVGTAHGTIEGLAQLTQVNERGVLGLVGNAAYVNLPNFLISELTSVTIEGWVTWNGGKAWQRVFDFGESDAQPNPEDVPKSGKTYLFLTPMASGAGSRFGFSLNGASVEKAVSLPMALAPTMSHVVAVVDTDADKMLYYLDGAPGGEIAFTAALSDINDVNVWLGRSQYSNDPAFTGTYHDFRIYDQALSPLQIATSFAAGPDPDFLAR